MSRNFFLFFNQRQQQKNPLENKQVIKTPKHLLRFPCSGIFVKYHGGHMRGAFTTRRALTLTGLLYILHASFI